MHALEQVHVQTLIPELPVETFDVRVLPWTPRLYVDRLALALKPLSDGLRYEFRPVVGPDMLRQAPRTTQRVGASPQRDAKTKMVRAAQSTGASRLELWAKEDESMARAPLLFATK